MSQTDPIRARAQADLVLVYEGDRKDVSLWEHSLRVTESALRIARLRDAPRPVDAQVLTLAGLYHDAGWAVLFLENAVQRSEILSRGTSDLQREDGASRLIVQMATLAPKPAVELAAAVIRQMNDRRTRLAEAQVLAEAENLDAFGLLTVWHSVRRSSTEGKGVQGALDTWQRQVDYRFWEARVSDDFRMESVKRLARARLAMLSQFFKALAELQAGADVEALVERVGEPLLKP